MDDTTGRGDRPDECQHDAEQLRRRTFSNGTIHFVRQCLTCGRASNAIAQKTLAPEEIAAASFDEQLQDRYWTELHRERLAELAERQAAERSEWFAEYDEYLHSPEWWDIRERVIVRAGGRCEGCGRRQAQHVHHLTYDHRGDEFLFELVALCRDCHERIHGRGRYAA